MEITRKVGGSVGRFEIAPGLSGYEEVDVSVKASESESLVYDLTATVKPDGTGKLIVTKLLVEQSEDGPPVQRGELGKISLEHFVRFVAAHTLEHRDRDGQKSLGLPGPPESWWARVETEGLTDDDLPDLASAYRWIRLQEGRPTALLAEELHLSPATVRRWLSKAVDAGLLTQEERSK